MGLKKSPEPPPEALKWEVEVSRGGAPKGASVHKKPGLKGAATCATSGCQAVQADRAKRAARKLSSRRGSRACLRAKYLAGLQTADALLAQGARRARSTVKRLAARAD